MLKKYSTAGFILLGLAILVFAHREWFFSVSNLAYDDWQTHFNDYLTGFARAPQAWDYANLGGVNITASFYVMNLLAGLFAKLGIGFPFSERLLYMWPIIIVGFVGSFVLLKHLFKNNVGAFLGALVYNSNVYFLLIQTRHLTIMAADAFLPLGVYLYIKLLEKTNVYYAIWTGLVATIIGYYDFRIFYIFAIIAAVILGYILIIERPETRIKIRQIIYSGVALTIAILLNMFWLLGLSKTQSVTNNDIFNRSIFGGDVQNLNNATALFHPFWNAAKPVWFQINQMPIYLWLVPILCFLAIYLFRQNKKVVLFGVIAILGILLTKQQAQPLTNLYSWLYANLPGFNAFREASKFFVIIGLGYSALIAALYSLTAKKADISKYKYAIAAVVVPLCLFNLMPYFTKSIESLLVARHVPKDYLVLKNKLGDDYYRTLWVPATTTWSPDTTTNPRIGVLATLNSSPEVKNISSKQYFASLFIPSVLNVDYYKNIARDSAVKYVVVPPRDIANDEDIYKSFGDDRDTYIHALDNLSWLKKVNVGTKEMVVYENTAYKPYFSSARTLNHIGSLNTPSNYYQFAQNTLQDEAHFVANTETDKIKTTAPLKRTQDMFENIQPSNLANGHIKTSYPLQQSKTNTLYADLDSPNYRYEIRNNSVTFLNSIENIVQANGQQLGHSDITPVSHTSLATGRTYAFAVGDTLYPLDTANGTARTIGNTDKPIKLFSATSANLVNNGSFEQGSWHTQTEDCNNYDKQPIISMAVTKDFRTDGKQSLVLGSKKHTACSSSNAMAVTAGQYYALRYDFKLKDGQRAGYELVFNDPKHTVLSNDQTPGSNIYTTLNTYFQAPEGATSVQLRLKSYPDDRSKTYAQTYYDNVQVRPLNVEADVAKSHTPNYQKIDQNGTADLTTDVSSAQYPMKNVIPNPSLEQGLWQKQVGDCNNYDSKPQLGMKQSKTASNGKKSLEISATNHVACTGPDAVPVKEGNNYLFSFDYQSPNAPTAGYYITFNDPAGTATGQQLKIEGKDWQHFTQSIQVPYGATTMQLSVYSYADDSGSSAQINRYDNFSLVNIPHVADRYYLVSTPKQTLQPPKHIGFDLDSPTKKRVHVQAAKTGFYLNMSESYNAGWRLELNDAKLAGRHGWLPNATPTAVAASDHFNLNGFLNSWYVDPAKLCGQGSSACHKNADGSWDMELVAEFTPQRYFYVGLIISGTTLAGCILFLIVAAIRRKHGKGSGTPPPKAIIRGGPPSLRERTPTRQRRDIRLLGRLAHVATKYRSR